MHVVPALLESRECAVHGLLGARARGYIAQVGGEEPAGGADIATPAVFHAAADSGPWIVKSVFEHASLGIDDSSVVSGSAAVSRTLDARRAEFGGSWFAERFVPGRELNVGVIAAPDGARALPVAEIRFDGFPTTKPAIVGYAAKWQPDSFEYRNTVRSFGVEPELAARATRLSLACWQLFALDGYARVDFRVDDSGTLYVLEVNANPCLSPDAGFAAALEQAGIGYTDAIGWLIADARRRTAPPGAPA